ncbi:helix-turn-helix domain-containing protein [Christensenellaceae bacterium OttesenSCG-928-L17]|nr:helix-turn-helix domain-containing protein [Christensenellaceae bacterium OttesenSCG-928-L17]
MNQTTNSTQSSVPELRAYKVEDIADILSVSMTSAYTLIRQGHFKVVRIGNAIRISKRSFDEWLDEQTL